jgi:integrase
VTIKRTIKNRITFITKPKCEFMSSHMGRRTLVTLLANKGVALTTIQEITGHEDIKTLIKYKKQEPDLIREAFEKVVEDEANDAAMQSLLKALANNADPEMMKEILEKLAAAQGNRKLRAV